MFLRASGERRLRRRLFSRRVRQAAPRCLRDRSLFCLGACCRGRENRARASLPCGTSNTCVMRLAGRGGTRGAAVFTPGEGKHAFAVIFLLCVGCFHAGTGKTGRLAEVRRFFGGKSARMSAERAASEVGRIREDGWEVSGKPRQCAAVCICDSKEGCAGDSPEKARPGVCRRFPQPVLSQGRERRRFGRMNGVSPGGSAVP